MKNSFKITAKVVGALYILGFIVGISASVMSKASPLSSVSTQTFTIACGAVLWLLASLGDLTHGVLMFSVLKPKSERIALGYLAIRILEACLVAFSALCILMQIPLAEEFIKQQSYYTSLLQYLSDLFLKAQEYSYQFGMITLGTAGLTLCIGLYKTKLVPTFWVVWGICGYCSFITGSILEVLSFKLQLMHTILGGLWEISIGVWLIVKGFNTTEILKQNQGSQS